MISNKIKSTALLVLTLILLIFAGCANNIGDGQDSSQEEGGVIDESGSNYSNETPDSYIEDSIDEEFADENVEIGELI